MKSMCSFVISNDDYLGYIGVGIDRQMILLNTLLDNTKNSKSMFGIKAHKSPAYSLPTPSKRAVVHANVSEREKVSYLEFRPSASHFRCERITMHHLAGQNGG